LRILNECGRSTEPFKWKSRQWHSRGSQSVFMGWLARVQSRSNSG